MAKGSHNGNGHASGNGHGHVTETPDVSHIKNIDVTHEASDVSIGGIMKFVIGLTVFGIIVSVLMWGTFRFLNAQEQQGEPKPGPMAMTKEERLPPEPRLQSAPGFGVKSESGEWVPLENREPEAEFKELREQWDRKLNCPKPAQDAHATAPADHGASQSAETHKEPCVPIDEAIQKLIDKGLPSRTTAAGEDLDLPTAASSGRVSGKAKQ
ncbi:MAG TPA: hypothetical protein VJU86_00810 [Pyrinomonadaceae bacterium]|nr:hypothetical protein [Pyrinomonadaceae bacterium]